MAGTRFKDQLLRTWATAAARPTATASASTRTTETAARWERELGSLHLLKRSCLICGQNSLHVFVVLLDTGFTLFTHLAKLFFGQILEVHRSTASATGVTGFRGSLDLADLLFAEAQFLLDFFTIQSAEPFLLNPQLIQASDLLGLQNCLDLLVGLLRGLLHGFAELFHPLVTLFFGEVLELTWIKTSALAELGPTFFCKLIESGLLLVCDRNLFSNFVHPQQAADAAAAATEASAETAATTSTAARTLTIRQGRSEHQTGQQGRHFPLG